MVLYGYFKSFAQDFFTFPCKFAHLTILIQTQHKQSHFQPAIDSMLPPDSRTSIPVSIVRSGRDLRTSAPPYFLHQQLPHTFFTIGPVVPGH